MLFRGLTVIVLYYVNLRKSRVFAYIYANLRFAQKIGGDYMNNSQSANLIKTLCKEKNVPMSRLLADCAIRKSLIYDMEKRNFTPSVSTFEKIANYLDVSVDYLLGKTDKKEKPTADEGDELSELLSELKGIITDMTENQKDALLDYAKYLKSKE